MNRFVYIMLTLIKEPVLWEEKTYKPLWNHLFLELHSPFAVVGLTFNEHTVCVFLKGKFAILCKISNEYGQLLFTFCVFRHIVDVPFYLLLRATVSAIVMDSYPFAMFALKQKGKYLFH